MGSEPSSKSSPLVPEEPRRAAIAASGVAGKAPAASNAIAANASTAQRTWLWLGPLAFFAAVAIAGTWPLLLRPDELMMAGGGGRDGLIFLWDLWWTREALCVQGSSPLFTELLYHPHGTPLLLHSLALGYGVLSLPFQGLAPGLEGVLLANSALVLFSFWMTGWLTYLLALRLTGDRGAALLAGLAFTLASFHYGNLPRLHILALESLPLVLLLLLRLLDRPQHWRAIGLGLGCAWVFWVSLEYALFLGLACGLLVALERRRLDRRRTLRALALAALTALLATAPFWLVAAEHGLSSSAAASFGLKEFFSADLLDLAMPVAQHPLWGEPVRALQQRLHRGHPGFELGQSYALLALAGVGAWNAWRSKCSRLRPWVIFTAVFAALSLGPTLHVAGFRTGLPLPFRALTWIPILEQARMPFRFFGLFQLGVVLLAAHGATHALQGLRRRGLALAGLGALVVFETLWVPLPLQRVEIPAPYARLAHAEGALIDWPPPDEAHLMLPTLHQIAHRRPLIEDQTWFYPRASSEVRRTAQSAEFQALLAVLFEGREDAEVAAQPRLDAPRATLERLAIRHVALRHAELGDEALTRAQRGLERFGFVLVARGDGVSIYRRAP
ncbi:MAG: hypothetical protein JNM84_12265 [Planctomycetes bacterium]|nr:hypothetical protein [Planctomycetota bacterium]